MGRGSEAGKGVVGRPDRARRHIEGGKAMSAVNAGLLSALLASVLFGLALVVAGEPALARGDAESEPDRAEIRRTRDGIPHLQASSWRGLGRAIGHAQAEDALCTLAEGFVTYAGRRSWFFGPQARPTLQSTFGQPRNLDLDFFFRVFADEDSVERYRLALPAELRQMVEGYAAGYNAYLGRARQDRNGRTVRPCLNEAWVAEIRADDLYRRMRSAQLAGGLARFIPEIVNAGVDAPESAVGPQATTASPDGSLIQRLTGPLGGPKVLGSNALAFGGAATGGDGAVLVGNPHWYWGGPDRFYQMHLRLPGRLDVAGVGFLGIPLVMIGFNDQVAWTHTVSAARRIGLFELRLDPGDRHRYLVDGVATPMQQRAVTVEWTTPDGTVTGETRILHSTRFGPVVDLGALDPSLGWTGERALAIRDVNLDNYRIFGNFFRWNRARSLNEFVAIQRQEVAMPWVNTVAIGRGDPRAWYGDLGSVPNVPDEHRRACAASLAERFAAVDPALPFLDGSRAACDWLGDPEAVQRGAMPAAAMPTVFRDDYVANMNDSYWLTNARAPIEGHPAILGGERQIQSLRSRLGHRIAMVLADGQAASSAELGRQVMIEVLRARSYAFERFGQPLIGAACGPAGSSPRRDLQAACATLLRWDGTGEAGAHGALLWEAYWAELKKLPIGESFQSPFSYRDPLETPDRPAVAPEQAAQALEAAAHRLESEGLPLDASPGQVRFIRSAGKRWPLFGGCSGAGYFSIACSDNGRPGLGPDTIGNSYLQVVRFDSSGVQAHTLLAHGLDEAALLGGRGSEPIDRYAHKRWLRFPFAERDIARDPALSRTVLEVERAVP